jgi:hypothetical protein
MLIPLLQAGCAWENIDEGDTDDDFRMQIELRVKGSIDPNLFYFIVFNFSGDKDQKPIPDFEDEERGLYWDAYYMYGNPRLTGHNFYRGIAGTAKDGNPKLDKRPAPSNELWEFVPTSKPTVGTSPTGNSIMLELDFGLNKPPSIVNMNMMVSSLPFDRVDNPDDPYDALIYDSFLFDGVTLNIGGSTKDFHEQDFKVEQDENIGENPPPNADITFWRVLVI